MESDAYILGVEPAELARLRSQHRAWVRAQHELLECAGLRAGQTALDLGCGPGTTTLELAHFVGPRGRVIACDASAGFVAALEAECERLGLGQVDARVRRAEDLGLEDASIDLAYSRWLLSWLPDVAPVFRQVARALRPGGAYALQEYVNWGAMTLLPRAEWFEVGVAACRASWRRGGGEIDAARLAPGFANELGLAVERFDVRTRSGAPGSPVWCWMSEFFATWLPKLVEHGELARADCDVFLREWRRAESEPHRVVLAPHVADVVLRKPR